MKKSERRRKYLAILTARVRAAIIRNPVLHTDKELTAQLIRLADVPGSDIVTADEPRYLTGAEMLQVIRDARATI